jgi:signal transduction histidine kinase/ActR/RegA family two-component response regulator
LSGEKGLVRVSHASFDAVAAGQASRLELQLFNRADGLPSDACRRGYQPAAFRASDGELWFATHKGAASVRPSEILTAAYEPPPIIEEIRAEMQLILVTAANREEIEIPAGTRHMSIRVSIPSLGRPEYARFQYRLEGFDGVWHDAGNERVIRFYDLQPGSYRFHVRAIGTDGRFVETPASVGLVVRPFYWQRLWFRAVCLFSLLGLVAGGVWRSQQSRIRRQEEKLREQETRRRLEAQLQQSQKMEAIGRLAGGIAHDFNNLLTTVSGNAELLQLELGEKSAQYGIAADISTAASRARELIAQILTFSRHRPVERRAVDIAPVIREALQLLRAGFPAMVAVQAEVPETLPLILADGAQIQRVVMNLGTNAAHAMGSIKGRIVVRAEECLVLTSGGPVGVPPGRYVCLTVADNGQGMDDQTLKRIFDPFFTTKSVGEGTGLGLSVVHGIVEAHAGFTTVESQQNAGTTFQIYLPVTTESSPPETAQIAALPSELNPAAVPTGRGQLILLVDDEDSVLKLTRAMLEKLGYSVEAVADPATALECVATNGGQYQMVITDFAMPGCDGVELSRKIWEQRPGLPVILYSGYGSRLTPEEAVKMGFAQLLAKPFTLHDLATAVGQALAESGEHHSAPVSAVRSSALEE